MSLSKKKRQRRKRNDQLTRKKAAFYPHFLTQNFQFPTFAVKNQRRIASWKMPFTEAVFAGISLFRHRHRFAFNGLHGELKPGTPRRQGGQIMPRVRAWWLVAAAAAGLAGSPARADDPPKPIRSSAPPTTLVNKLFGHSKSKNGPVARGAAPPTIVAPLAPEIVAAALQAEQEAWERRMSVCDKLRQVAFAANDEDLMRQVDDLERQATALYKARTTALGIPKAKPALEETASARGLDSTKAAARKLTAPALPTAIDPAVRTAEARTPNDVIREVLP